jgi:hypothetical protein
METSSASMRSAGGGPTRRSGFTFCLWLLFIVSVYSFQQSFARTMSQPPGVAGIDVAHGQLHDSESLDTSTLTIGSNP